MVNTEGKNATWDFLVELGFEQDDAVLSDFDPGLSFDFGNFKLSASSLLSPRSGKVILFSGVLSSPRTIAEINFEMPLMVESRYHCAAWITRYLDQASPNHLFVPKRPVPWVVEGRKLKTLLPD